MIGASLIGALPAQAATLDVTGGVLSYTATTGSTNALLVTFDAEKYKIDDPGESALTLGGGAVTAGCENDDANTVFCPAGGIASWNVQLSNLDDSADLSAVSQPTTLRGGAGTDVLVGGAGADTFVWLPGDGNEDLEGGPGPDVLDFEGANVSEIIAITRSSSGFQLTRDVANVIVVANGVESLVLDSLGGDDKISTTGLAETVQTLTGGAQTVGDTLDYDPAGACTLQLGALIQSSGSWSVTPVGFESLSIPNPCAGSPSSVNVAGGVLAYAAGAGALNDLIVTFDLGGYKLTDPGAGGIVPLDAALSAGCTNVGPTTVVCPPGGIGSLSVELSNLDDTADLSAVSQPTTLRGGPGIDELVGGSAADTFRWLPGDGNEGLEGGPGLDVLDFEGANVSEIIAITPSSSGFQLTRNVANVIVVANGVESLVLDSLGGDDTVSTIGLVATSQSLSGGLQTTSDALGYDADGTCALLGPGSIQTPGRQPVLHDGFEILPTLDACSPTAAPSLGPVGLSALSLALGLVARKLAQRGVAPD